MQGGQKGDDGCMVEFRVISNKCRILGTTIVDAFHFRYYLFTGRRMQASSLAYVVYTFWAHTPVDSLSAVEE